nr:MAG TPA: hypothetical protein [Caudoviricetes sp.]
MYKTNLTESEHYVMQYDELYALSRFRALWFTQYNYDIIQIMS